MGPETSKAEPNGSIFRARSASILARRCVINSLSGSIFAAGLSGWELNATGGIPTPHQMARSLPSEHSVCQEKPDSEIVSGSRRLPLHVPKLSWALIYRKQLQR